MKTTTKVNTNIVDMLEFINNDDVIDQFGEAAASAMATDQVVTWAKFILTDDKPNVNGQRVPEEEFDNLIRTGNHKPVKMALGEIKDGHEDAKPIGVITNLIKDGNKVIALAALWDHERSEDVSHVKDLVKSGKPVNVSWEILYGNSRIKNGISDLLDIVLKAVTIVGMPAYAGRTQLLAVAAKKWSPAYIAGLPDSSFMLIEKDGSRYFAFRDDSGKIDPIRFPVILEEAANAPLPQNALKSIRHQVTKLNAMIMSDASIQELLAGEEDFITEEQKLETKDLEIKISDLEAKLAVANDKLASKETELVTAQEQFNLASTNLKALEEEVVPLREFKLVAEVAAQRDSKLSAIKTKFGSLGLEKSDEYFSENADKLLGLDDNGLDFMLQEMVAFKDSGEGGEGKASKRKTSGLPNLPGEGGEVSVSDMATALRERSKK